LHCSKGEKGDPKSLLVLSVIKPEEKGGFWGGRRGGGQGEGKRMLLFLVQQNKGGGELSGRRDVEIIPPQGRGGKEKGLWEERGL